MIKCVLKTLVDKVAKLATNPMVFNNEDEAQRYYEEIILQQPIPAARPQDFEWITIGQFDRVTGKVTHE